MSIKIWYSVKVTCDLCYVETVVASVPRDQAPGILDLYSQVIKALLDTGWEVYGPHKDATTRTYACPICVTLLRSRRAEEAQLLERSTD
jgi:hypothetical protein